jgi:hypothetical protein
MSAFRHQRVLAPAALALGILYLRKNALRAFFRKYNIPFWFGGAAPTRGEGEKI